ncbi:hypothetical protein IG631_18372 [Alternaria alternata]|nr:hypothetical protein IG631_18372 [Alternaria alternata]
MRLDGMSGAPCPVPRRLCWAGGGWTTRHRWPFADYREDVTTARKTQGRRRNQV